MEHIHRKVLSGARMYIGLLTLLLAGVLVLVASCVERRLTIRSEPPGATVYLDGEKMGTTPLTTSFTHYGTRRIVLIKQGYQPKESLETISPPIYQLFPLDFFFEVLVPFTLVDEREFEYTLEPKTEPEMEDILERAVQMRQRLEEGE